MMPRLITNIAIESGLKLKHQTNPFDNIYQKQIPSNAFGVFVGIDRSIKHTQLSQANSNVHGCIGYWTPNYTPMNNHQIIEKILEVATSATWQDDRKDNFKMSLYTDLDAIYKIYFMLEPVMMIDPATGMFNNIQFDNNKHGIIVHGKNGHRATYLPGVFENIGWNELKNSIDDKAGLDNTSNTSYYAYKAKIISLSLASYFIDPTYQTINNIYNDFVPYMIHNNHIQIDKTQDVRNIATMYDILQLESYGYNLKFKHQLVQNIHYYIDVYKQNRKQMRQASGFLLLALNKLNIEPDIQNDIAQYLISSLDDLEPDFELGEALYALAQSGNNDKVTNKMNNLINIYANIKPLANMNIDDIFRYNWHIKAIGAYVESHQIYNISQQITNLSNFVYQIINQYSIPTIETNYLAVGLESMTGLIRLNNQLTMFDDLVGKIFIELSNRNVHGLYAFNDNDQSMIRLDITGHVLNCYYNLGFNAGNDNILDKSDSRYKNKYIKYKLKYYDLKLSKIKR